MAFKDRILRTGAYALMPHFTVGVMGLVRDGDGRFLMVLQGVRQAGSWGFPGGFVRRQETPEMSLARELAEEVGVDPLGQRFVAAYKQPWARHYDLVFRVDAHVPSEGGRSQGREIRDCAWLTAAEIADLSTLTREAAYFLATQGLDLEEV